MNFKHITQKLINIYYATGGVQAPAPGTQGNGVVTNNATSETTAGTTTSDGLAITGSIHGSTTTNGSGVWQRLSPSGWAVGDTFSAGLAKLAFTIAIATAVVSIMFAVAYYGISREKGAAKELIISKLVIIAIIGIGIILLDAVFTIAINLF